MKVIIDNRGSLEINDAISLVKLVIDKGRISNNGKQYCYATSFIVDGDTHMVYAVLNKNSDKFIIN